MWGTREWEAPQRAESCFLNQDLCPLRSLPHSGTQGGCWRVKARTVKKMEALSTTPSTFLIIKTINRSLETCV